jgi:hypothetical protein
MFFWPFSQTTGLHSGGFKKLWPADLLVDAAANALTVFALIPSAGIAMLIPLDS